MIYFFSCKVIKTSVIIPFPPLTNTFEILNDYLLCWNIENEISVLCCTCHNSDGLFGYFNIYFIYILNSDMY